MTPPFDALFDAEVSNGSLLLRSTRVRFRLLGRMITVPRWVAPRVELLESVDDVSDQQRVELTMTLPGVGKIYEYAGTFRYRVGPVTPKGLSTERGDEAP